MKSITEFAVFALNKGLQAKAALAAEGKTPEEIQTSLGETFKFEGDKLKHFINALEVATANADGLMRVLVVSYAEGEKTAPKAVKVEETHYIPEFKLEAKPITQQRNDPKGGGGKKAGKGDMNRVKTSPWGLTPEEKAAKKGGGNKAPKPTT